MDRLWSESARPRQGARGDLRPSVLVGRGSLLLRRTLDRERSRWFLWSAVFFASGIGIYFQLPAEPPVWAVALLVILACSLGLSTARPGGSKIAAAVSLVLFGIAAGKVRTETGGPGAMPSPLGVVSVEGWLERLEHKPGGKGARLYLRPVTIEGADAGQMPKRILVSWRGQRAGHRLRPGDYLRIRARFLDLLEPAWPGGYDAQFVRWYQGIGASAFILGPPKKVKAPGAPPLVVGWAARIQLIREEIGQRLKAALPGTAGAVLVALIVGDRTGIPIEARDNLRAAGLAHLLAISGLHMALFAGGMFWLIRAALALSPGLAVGWPIKKISAALALLAAAAYLAISGSGLATQRAFVMIAIMFLAILCRRPALSMRNIALAAFTILLVRPESLMSVSFQLSFMAVIGLVALFEAYDIWRTARGLGTVSDWPVLRLAKRGGDYVLRVGATTLVAGLATAPIAAFHFNRVAAFSLLGNLIAIPVVGTLVMPAAIAGLLLMPFGLEAWPLTVTGWGIELVLGAARYVSSLPGAVRLVPAAPDLAGVFMALGVLWICLWQTGWRTAGLGFLCLGFAITATAALPDLLVSPDGRQTALKHRDGTLRFSSRRAARYVSERWLLKFADPTPFKDAARRDGFSCDVYGCSGRLRDGSEVAVIRHPSILPEECRRAAIVVVEFNYRGGCSSAKVLITPRQLRSRGVHVISVGEEGSPGESLALSTGRPYRGARPWNAAPQKIHRKPPPAQDTKPKPDRHPPSRKPKAPDRPKPPLQVRI